MTKEPYILYIEDERPTIQLVREVLKLSGYNVVGKTTGQEGLALMRRDKPDLLLLDLMMPGISGTQVYREIKQDEQLAYIPVIIISAVIPDSHRLLADDLPPVDDYITKPFDVDRLIKSVQTVITNQVPVV